MSNFYGYSWDEYVKKIFPAVRGEKDVYAGDEWGNPQWWEYTYTRLFTPQGAEGWQRAVEIGAGSGKYTDMLLSRSKCEVLAADVSDEFLNVLREREQKYVDARRLHPFKIISQKPDELYREIERRGWVGSLDALYSIDAMVHVDLQFLSAYLVTAAATLRPGGKLILTLADATSPGGVAKLLKDITTYYPLQGMPSLKFEYLSPDILRAILPSLGFEILHLDHDAKEFNDVPNRDLFLAAELKDPAAGRDARKYLGIE